MTTQTTDSLHSTQTELEKLVSEMRTLMANKNLDSVPEIKALRERLDEGMHNVRDAAVRAAQEAANQAGYCAVADDISGGERKSVALFQHGFVGGNAAGGGFFKAVGGDAHFVEQDFLQLFGRIEVKRLPGQFISLLL